MSLICYANEELHLTDMEIPLHQLTSYTCQCLTRRMSEEKPGNLMGSRTTALLPEGSTILGRDLSGTLPLSHSSPGCSPRAFSVPALGPVASQTTVRGQEPQPRGKGSAPPPCTTRAVCSALSRVTPSHDAPVVECREQADTAYFVWLFHNTQLFKVL